MVLSKATLYRPLMPEQMIVFHQPLWIIQAASSQPHPQHGGLFWGIRVIKGNSRDEPHLWAGCTHYSSEATPSWSKSDTAEAPSTSCFPLPLLLLLMMLQLLSFSCKVEECDKCFGTSGGKMVRGVLNKQSSFSFFPVPLSKLVYFTSSHAPLHAGSLQALEWTCLLAEIF